MDIIFVEDYVKYHAVLFPKGKVIALTPEVMHGLDKAGIEYAIPEDYMIWQEDDKYDAWLVELFQMFGRILFKAVDFNSSYK